MVKYWPSATGKFAEVMNKTSKLVFSKTVSKAEWNATIIKDVIKDDMMKIKQQKGKDMVLLAGADIASTFIKLDLIDEYRIIVNPVIFGAGTPLFQNFAEKQYLKFIKTQSFTCDNVILYYEPVKK